MFFLEKVQFSDEVTFHVSGAVNRRNVRIWGSGLEHRIDVCRVTRGAHIENLWLSKKNFFSFPVAVNNSIKVGPLVFWL
jgi:hypothetical protein